MTTQAKETKEPKAPSKPQDMSKKVITLKYPVEVFGEMYTSLTVRRLKARDFRQFDVLEGGQNAAAIAMAALVCGVDEGVIDELDASDYIAVQEAVADFFPQELVDKMSAKV